MVAYRCQMQHMLPVTASWRFTESPSADPFAENCRQREDRQPLWIRHDPVMCCSDIITPRSRDDHMLTPSRLGNRMIASKTSGPIAEN